VISDPKATQSVRSLDAPAVVLDSLRRHRHAQARHRLEIGEAWMGEDDLVFTSPTGRPTDPAACRREFAIVAKAAGLDGWTPNELRHSAASLMSDAGMPIEQVADQLGHKDLRMLQRHYRHRIRPTVNGGMVLGDILEDR
jgi:integrase